MHHHARSKLSRVASRRRVVASSRDGHRASIARTVVRTLPHGRARRHRVGTPSACDAPRRGATTLCDGSHWWRHHVGDETGRSRRRRRARGGRARSERCIRMMYFVYSYVCVFVRARVASEGSTRRAGSKTRSGRPRARPSRGSSATSRWAGDGARRGEVCVVV